jgi:hypothetical protein
MENGRLLNDYSSTKKGTVFEVLGDFHHSNLLIFKPDEFSDKKNRNGGRLDSKGNLIPVFKTNR